MVPDELRSLAAERLAGIAAAHGVKILYACESGSRAWGFPSPDSDYDIRFIYAHAPEWYYSIEEGRDVIEAPIERHELGEIDLGGWDLRKALRLARKSNPVIWEWLQSPIAYLQDTTRASAAIRRSIDPCFSPVSACHHYLSICRRTMEAELKLPEVKIKKYFYMLRPLLAAAWIERYRSAPPMELEPLLAMMGDDDPAKAQVRELQSLKQRTDERIPVKRRAAVDSYLAAGLERLTAAAPSLPSGDAGVERLDDLMRDMTGFRRGA